MQIVSMNWLDDNREKFEDFIMDTSNQMLADLKDCFELANQDLMMKEKEEEN